MIVLLTLMLLSTSGLYVTTPMIVGAVAVDLGALYVVRESVRERNE